MRDVVVGYCSVTVYFDPLRMDAAWLEAEVRALAERTAGAGEPAEGRLIEVPVCYGGEYGPDLADVAAFAGCSVDEVDRAALRRRRIASIMVGFVPGFAYMASVDPRIAAPRRTTPRTAVPAGSVAVAAGQTGVYPSETPGGWHLIGRTPVKPYDAVARGAVPLQPGDRVRFHPHRSGTSSSVASLMPVADRVDPPRAC